MPRHGPSSSLTCLPVPGLLRIERSPTPNPILSSPTLACSPYITSRTDRSIPATLKSIATTETNTLWLLRIMPPRDGRGFSVACNGNNAEIEQAWMKEGFGDREGARRSRKGRAREGEG